MATQLDVVNNVLARLREPTVSSTTENEYSKLVSSIFIEAHEEVMDEWNWSYLQTESYIVVPAGVTSHIIDILSTTGTPLSRDAFIERRYGEAYFTWVDGSPSDPDFDTMHGVPVEEMAIADLRHVRRRGGVQTAEFPSSLAIIPYSINDELLLEFSEETQKEITLAVLFTARPDYYRTDGSTDNTEIGVPVRPVQELTMLYALNERGEEMGEPGNLAEGRYVKALAAAKEWDIKAKEYADRLDWSR